MHLWGSKATLHMKWDGKNYTDLDSFQEYHYARLKGILKLLGHWGGKRWFVLLNCLLREMDLLNSRALVSLSQLCKFRARAELLIATRILPSHLFSYVSCSLLPKQMLGKHAFKGKKRHWILSCSRHYASQAGKVWDSERAGGPGQNEAEAWT